VPEGAVPFICPPGGVPDGAELFVCAPDCGVPDGAALLPPDCWVSIGACGVDDTEFSLDGVDVLDELCVQPAIMIPAMRIADAINMTIMLFFME
jgi:hypothetical protein